MSEFVYKDYLPANARVIVDYKADKPVLFSYPVKRTYKQAVWKQAYFTIMGFWIAIHMTILVYLAFYLGMPYLIIKYTFFPYEKTVTVAYNFVTQILPMVYFISYFFGPPAIFTWWLSLKKERMAKWVPKIGYWAAKINQGMMITTFTKKDVYKNKVVISNFSNVFLYYKTTGDFNKYLEKVEVIEIPYHYRRRSKLMPWKIKKEKNEYDFRAVFHFSQAIKTGRMDVEFH